MFDTMGTKEKLFAFAGGAIVIIAATIYFLSPSSTSGTWRYGACQVFLERTVRFPTTVKQIAVSETRVGAKILFTHTNPYGYTQTQLLECIFKTENNAVSLTKATIDRLTIDQDTLNTFNKSLPVILRQLPDLTYPPRPPSDLEKIKS